MATYRKTKNGDWVAYGPATEVKPGDVAVTKRNGTVDHVTVDRPSRSTASTTSTATSPPSPPPVDGTPTGAGVTSAASEPPLAPSAGKPA